MHSHVTTRHGPPTHPETCKVEFQSVLRIRPLKKAEKEDHVVLEPSKFNNGTGAVALLHPIIHMTSPEGRRRSFERETGSPMFIKEGEEQQFHFDNILDINATQDKVHYSMGLNMALDAMEPLKHIGAGCSSSAIRNHLVVSMGVSNTGKTYTSFGSQKATARTSGKHAEDGLVPRILESFFSQSQHHIRDGNLSFAARIAMLHVKGEHVYDMLTVPPEPQASSATKKKTPKKSGVRAMVANFERGGKETSSGTEETVKVRNGMEEVKIEQDSKTHDFIINPTARNCRNVVDARETLHYGLKRANSSGLIGGLVGKSNRGHTLISIQPVLVAKRSDVVKHCGGTITVLDMAGIEKVKKSRGAAMRDSIAINSSVSSVMHCLRTIKHNNDVISGETTLDVVCEDDESFDGSDISNVSEEKGAKIYRNLKKVPYLQSKLTTLLQPCFSAASSNTVVTMLLAAYPGHRDYSEKKALLCDFELLRGTSIASGAVNTRDTNSKRRRRSSSEDMVRANTGMDKEFELSDIEESEDETEAPPVLKQRHANVGARKKPHENRSTQKSTPHKSSSKASYPSTLKSIKESSPSLMPTTPSAPTESMLGIDDATLPPPPFAPTSHLPKPVKAPTLHDSVAQARQLPHDSVSVTMDPPSDASNANAGIRVSPLIDPQPSLPCAKDQTAPPHAVIDQNDVPTSGGKQRTSTVRATVSASPNIRPPLKPRQSPLAENNVLTDQSPNRTWTTESPMKAINKVVHSSKKKGRKAIQQVEKIVATSITEEKPATERVVTSMAANTEEHDGSTKGGGTDPFAQESKQSEKMLLLRLQELERKNEKLSKQNTKLDDRCRKLVKEKEKLAESLREARRHNRQADWTALDEEEFRNSRRLRLRDQQLIRSPLRQHLEDVDETHDIHSTWLKTGKKHFDLRFPSKWTRAPDLDRRDRAREAEGMAGPSSSPAIATKEQKKQRKVSRKSTEKRKLFDSFKAVVKENKKLKFDLED